MILPFVRTLFADAQKTAAFQRAGGLLKSRAGRSSVSGLTTTAKSLFLPLFQHTSGKKLIVIVPDSRTADRMVSEVAAFAELSGACPPDSIVTLPAYDVLPFEGLSPHAEIQEQRAATLWRIATGAAQVVIVPAEAACMKMRDTESYRGLAQTVRRGGEIEPEKLVVHLHHAGYSHADIV